MFNCYCKTKTQINSVTVINNVTLLLNQTMEEVPSQLIVSVCIVYWSVVVCSMILGNNINRNYKIFVTFMIGTTFLVIFYKRNYGRLRLLPREMDIFSLEQYCNCTRKLPQKSNVNETVNFNQTTCSYDAFRRGSHQKVAAFTFYGNSKSESHKAKKYFSGIKV